jgi:tetratricopeptide (TPR) repeat protein/TolB-like protein
MRESSIGPYRVLEHLGSGAHGDVFLAADERLHRRVAIKTVSGTARASAAEARRRLMREGRAAARLSHPNIATLFDVVETEDAVHIIMEYVRGTTLAARARQGPLPPMQVLDLGLQLSSALAHAHSLGVVHRDLKPANIALSPDGQAKILDFGLATTTPGLASLGIDAGDGSSEALRTVGTPPYMPPEHLMGQPVDNRGDIYSLGVTLFEALTGRRPFEGTDGVPLVTAILTTPTPRARSFVPDIPFALDDVIFRAIARKPVDRYPSASELHRDLKRVESGIADPSTRGFSPAMRLPASRRRLVAGVAATAAIAALTAYLGRHPGAWRSTEGRAADLPRAPDVLAVLPLAGPSDDPRIDPLATGVAEALITTLSKIHGVTVVSRAATLKFRDRKQEPAVVARELGATLLVDGNIQRFGEKLRITLGVVEPGSRVVKWQSSYDGSFADVLTLQSDVAAAVASGLAVTLTPADQERIRDLPTDNAEAFADYAQAKTFLERPDVQENVDRSIRLFKAALQRDPRFARAHAGLGQAYWRKYEGSRDESWSIHARDEINEALRLDPNDMGVRMTLATVYRGMGKLAEAIEELQKITATNRQADEAFRLLGQALTEARRFDEAATAIRSAIRLRPAYWAHHYSLGVTFYRAGRYSEALATLNRAAQLQPDNAWTHQMIGTTYHAMDDTKNAIANYEKAVQLGDPAAYTNLGVLYAAVGDLDAATRAREHAVKLDPKSALKHHNLAAIYGRTGRAADARREYERTLQLCHEELKLKPNDGVMLSTVALTELKLGRTSSAERSLARAIAAGAGNADVRYAEAVMMSALGRNDRAAAALEKAVAAGYSIKRARRDPELASLMADPRFARITEVSHGQKPGGGGH